MKLENDEQITFITNSGSEYDVAKKIGVFMQLHH